MKISFNEDMIIAAKRMLALNHKRNKYKNVFDLLKDDIFKLVEIGLNYNSILELINNELQVNIKYHTFFAWIQKNIKQKNQNSNNTLRNNSQIKKVELKKETKKVKENNDNPKNKDEEVDEEDWKSVIFPQIEKACEGMKKANLRI